MHTKSILLSLIFMSVAPLYIFAMMTPLKIVSPQQKALNSNLQTAAQNSNLHEAETLIAQGADSNKVLKDVARIPSATIAIITLVKAGADIDNQGTLGYSALHKAVAGHQLNNVIALLALGANPYLQLDDADYDLNVFPKVLTLVPIKYTPLELAQSLHLTTLLEPIIIVLKNVELSAKDSMRLSHAILSLRKTETYVLPKDLLKNIMQHTLVGALVEEKMETIKAELEAAESNAWESIDKPMLKKALKISILREFVLPKEIEIEDEKN